MIIIGELINATRKAVKDAIANENAAAIGALASAQHEAGAHYIDVNAGTFVDREADCLSWLVRTVQAAVDAPLALDSPNPAAIEAALKVHNGVPMINSVSLEKERFDRLIPILAGTQMKVIALCMSDDGMPETMDERMKIADKLVNGLVQNNVPVENIFVDPLVQPVSVKNDYGMAFLNTVERIMSTFDGIHTACGLSNISFGLPARQYLNRTFMVMAVQKGLDGAICNPLDQKMMANIVAAEALAGRDDYCMNYLNAFSAGKLGG